MADKQKVAIICITLLLSSFLSTFVISLDRSLILNVDLENPTVVQYAQGNNSTMDVGNFSRGGYHLVTGDWWEPPRPFNVSITDSDGDGVPGSNDSHPLDPALPPVNSARASLCISGPNQPVPFSDIQHTSNSQNTYSVAWGDVDGDGDLDLAVGNNGVNEVYLHNGTALATTPAWTSSNSLDTSSVAWGDVDGDGDLDLAVGNRYDNNEVYLNSGTALATTPAWTSSNSLDTSSVAWGDVNGDGDLDLAVGNYKSNNEIYLNLGTALATTPAWTSSNSLSTWSVAWGDVNGDGDLDLAVGNSNGNNEVYLNSGTALATTPAWTSSNSLDTYSVAWGDVDGDGDLDLAVGNYNGNKEVYLNSGTALATTPAWTSSNSMSTYSVAWGDVDGDGDLELAVGNNGANEVYLATLDSDGDWISDDDDAIDPDPTQSVDFDGDGHGDNPQGRQFDSCSGYWGDSWRDRWGCPDEDGDGQSNLNDDFWTKDTQWIDSDGDGLGDNWGDHNWNSSRNQSWPGQYINNSYLPDPSPLDYDNDGFEDSALQSEGAQAPFDDCLLIFGSSTEDQSGCVDSDGDGWSDDGDSHPGDGTQHSDSDGDGYGDSLSGNLPDACPSEAGNSTRGMGYGCPDSDGDGWDDVSDDLPNNSSEWSDLDSDGYGDNVDECPYAWGNTTLIQDIGCSDSDADGIADRSDAFSDDITQWLDSDGDGFGDDPNGTQADDCPSLAGSSLWNVVDGERLNLLGCADGDGDGYVDSSDDCPVSAGSSQGIIWGCPDADGDGTEDLEDDCPTLAGNSTVNLKACSDSDGDGIADLEDPLPLNGTGTADDWDGDSHNNSVDVFPSDETQWADEDGDGLGDEPTGRNPDPSPGDYDNDGRLDPSDLSTDELGCLLHPEEGKDAFPQDILEWSDFDGDCIGDNADADDDNDGYTDDAEFLAGTDPFSAADKPVESFEIMVPGTNIGVGGWDLIGIFGGVPFFGWILFGFITRNSRCRKFEGQLLEASSPQELEDIALRLEYSLMLRLLGPHQGIRLERLRSELDDGMAGETHHVPEILEPEDITEDQTHIVEHEIHIAPTDPQIAAAGVIKGDGYEWVEHNGVLYYRSPGSDDGWNKWES